MLNYEKYLESKNVGILYHFTGLISLYYIQKTDYLESNRTVDTFENLMKSYNLEDKSSWHYISFTRNKNFHKTGQMMMDNYMSCRMHIDGNSLSNKFKIYKVNYFPDHSYRIKEAEECVVVPYKLKNIMQYTMKIEVPEFGKFLQEIKYNLDMQDFFGSTIKWTLYELNIDLSDTIDMDELDDMRDDEINDEFNNFEKYETIYQRLYDGILDRIRFDDYLK